MQIIVILQTLLYKMKKNHIFICMIQKIVYFVIYQPTHKKKRTTIVSNPLFRLYLE